MLNNETDEHVAMKEFINVDEASFGDISGKTRN